MLQSLHVKNLALIEEAEVDFSEGLNIPVGRDWSGKVNHYRIDQSCAWRKGTKGNAAGERSRKGDASGACGACFSGDRRAGAHPACGA